MSTHEDLPSWFEHIRREIEDALAFLEDDQPGDAEVTLRELAKSAGKFGNALAQYIEFGTREALLGQLVGQDEGGVSPCTDRHKYNLGAGRHPFLWCVRCGHIKTVKE